MNKLAKVSIITSLVLSILACSVLSPQTDKTSEITLTDEKPIVVLDTGNSGYPRIVLYKGNEVIVPDLDIDQNGEITDVHGATFISPDGNSIYLYFENGMPVRAIVDGHLIQFENFIGGTVDITFISPDGTLTKKEHVPFDSSQIPSIGFQSNAHLASIVRMPNNKDINWLSFVQNATTAFFCVAAATAVIVPTAGTATAILAAGCAVLIYSAYLAIANKEPPISVEKADIAISGAGCAFGVAKKDPIAVKDCADAVIDTVEVVKKETHEIEQKLVTKVGADPSRRDTLFSTSIVEPISPNTDLQQPPECAQLNLTPEELVNCGAHEYTSSGTWYEGDCSYAYGKKHYEGYVHSITFPFLKSGELPDLKKISPNVFIHEEDDSYGYHWTYTLTFNSEGFTQDIVAVSSGTTCKEHVESILVK